MNRKAQSVAQADGFVSVDRAWKTGNSIKLVLPKQIEIMESHPMAVEQRNHQRRFTRL